MTQKDKLLFNECIAYLENLAPEEIKKMQEDFDNDKTNYFLPEGLELILPDSLK